MGEQEFYTVSEVAGLLKVSEKFIRDEIRRKRLRAIEVGKGYRISRGDFQAYNKQRETRESDDLAPV